MSLQRSGDLRRNVNLPNYWRREWYEEPVDVANIASIATPGTLISTSRTVTLYEPSYIRIHAKAYALADDDSIWYQFVFALFEGAGGITQRDVTSSWTYHNAAIHIHTPSVLLYDGSYTGASTGTPYVFELRSWTNVANKIAVYSIKWTVDVCRA